MASPKTLALRTLEKGPHFRHVSSHVVEGLGFATVSRDGTYVSQKTKERVGKKPTRRQKKAAKRSR